MEIKFIDENFPRSIRTWPAAVKISKEIGKIVHLDVDGKFYFQTFAEMKLLQSMTETLTKHYSACKPMSYGKKELQAGTPVIARWSEDGKYYRGIIKRQSKKNSSFFVVKFVDFGNHGCCNIGDIFSDVLHRRTPEQAHQFVLAGVAPKSGARWTDPELDCLFDAVKDKMCIVELHNFLAASVVVRVVEPGYEIEDLATYAIQQGAARPST